VHQKLSDEFDTHLPEDLKVKIEYEKKKQQDTVIKALKEIENRKVENERITGLNETKKLKPVETPEVWALRDLRMPESFAFTIHKEFRIWFATIQNSSFPKTLAHKCKKIAIELQSSLKQNCLQTINRLDDKMLGTGNSFQTAYRRMVFSMVVMHAVINSRERYGPFGWT
jgi:hypothetical protein